MRRVVCYLVIVLSVASGCSQRADKDTVSKTVDLTFQIELDQEVYQDSAWADPPQMAVWLENQQDQSIQTVMVTHRTGACDWQGKLECSVALPYWIGFYNRETKTQGPPTWTAPAPDAVTCATPKAQWTRHVAIKKGTSWRYYIEVNVSGDFNPAFVSLSPDGRSDRYGNGQPSLVYQGVITAMNGTVSHPLPIGRTDQYQPESRLINNLEGMTTALDLLKSITLSCKE